MAINFPNSPTTGDTHTAAGVEWQYDGEKWVSQASGGGGGASVTVSDTAPASPSQGDLWWDSSDDAGVLFIWYDDADGGQWVETSGTGQDLPLWTRTGTTLEPATAGDDVFTSGDVKVGGTTAAPKIDLKADGSATFAGGGTSATPGVSITKNNSDGSFPALFLQQDDNVGNFITCKNGYLGQNTITLSADGSASFAGTIQAPGLNRSASAGAGLKMIGDQITVDTSSIRFKKDVEDIEESYAVNVLKNARPVWFRSKHDSDDSSHSYWGFIAEEIAAVEPRLCDFEDGEPYSVEYAKFSPILLKLIQMQEQRIEALEAKLAALEGGTN